MDPASLTFVLGALVAEDGRGLVCDLGFVRNGPELVMAVTIENKTDAAVVIRRTDGSCVPSIVKWRELKPGEKATMTDAVKVETKSFSGPISKSRTLQIEAKGSGKVTFECSSCGAAGGEKSGT